MQITSQDDQYSDSDRINIFTCDRGHNIAREIVPENEGDAWSCAFCGSEKIGYRLPVKSVVYTCHICNYGLCESCYNRPAERLIDKEVDYKETNGWAQGAKIKSCNEDGTYNVYFSLGWCQGKIDAYNGDKTYDIRCKDGAVAHKWIQWNMRLLILKPGQKVAYTTNPGWDNGIINKFNSNGTYDIQTRSGIAKNWNPANINFSQIQIGDNINYHTMNGWEKGIIRNVYPDRTYDIQSSNGTIARSWRQENIRFDVLYSTNIS